MSELVYKALLIGNGAFADPNLRPLSGPANDVRLLRDALVHPSRGLHRRENVRCLVDRPCPELLVEIEQFFLQARKDDQLFLYYSGHGKSWNQVLYMCACDTKTTSLVATAVSAKAIDEMIGGSPSSRIVLVLDCCHSGLFAGGKGDEQIELTIPPALRGRGRYVLASAQGAELAADGKDASPFTRFFVEGLLSEDADGNQDGFVTVHEIYEYVYSRVLEVSRQKPQISVDDSVANVVLARRPPRGDVASAPKTPLPPQIDGTGLPRDTGLDATTDVHSEQERQLESQLQKTGEFEGRRWLHDRVIELSQQTKVVVLVGEPGWGKTAFLSNFIREHAAHVGAYHFCRHDVAATIDTTLFVQGIARMLASKSPQYAEELRCDPDPIAAARCNEAPSLVFSEVLQRASRAAPFSTAQSRYWMVIDGLDESVVERDPARHSIVDVLKAQVATFAQDACRFTLLLSVRCGHAQASLSPFKELEVVAEDRDNCSDIEGYVRHAYRDTPHLVDGVGSTESVVVKAIAEKASGNFYYASLAISLLKLGRQTLESLDCVPAGLDALYKWWVGGVLKRRPDSRPIVESFLSGLLAAKDPIPFRAFVAACDVAQADLLAVIEDLAAFVRVVGDRTLVYHKSFTDWLGTLTGRTENDPISLDSLHGARLLANMCWRDVAGTASGPPLASRLGRSGRSSCSSYTLEHGVAHLVEANRLGDAVRLAALLVQHGDLLSKARVDRDKVISGASRDICNSLQPGADLRDVDLADLSVVLGAGLYEVAPLERALNVVVERFADRWTELIDGMLEPEDFVLRYAFADALGSHASERSSIIESAKQLVRDSRVNRQELGAYVFRSMYSDDPKLTDPAVLRALADAEVYSVQSAVGDLLLNLSLRDEHNESWTEGTRFWRPVWDYNRQDTADIQAVLCFRRGRPTSGLDDLAMASYKALEGINSELESLRGPRQYRPFIESVVDDYFALGARREPFIDIEEDFKNLDVQSARRLLAVFFAHLQWDIAEQAAALAVGRLRSNQDAEHLLAPLLDSEEWRVCFGAIEAAFQARLVDGHALFTSAVHRFHAHPKCRIRALCAEDLTAWVLACPDARRDALLDRFDAELTRWLWDDDIWVLEHVYRLFRALGRKRVEARFAAKGQSPLLQAVSSKQPWYTLDRAAFLQGLEAARRATLPAG
jgi:hypothetical protein